MIPPEPASFNGLRPLAFDRIVQMPALPSMLVARTLLPLEVGHSGLNTSCAVTSEQAGETSSTQALSPRTPPRTKRPASVKSVSKSKGKKKAKHVDTPSKRFVWTTSTVETLLHLRFKDADVKKRVEAADTNLKKRVEWQFVASRLSEELKVVLSGDQVLSKYKKLKCEYRQGKTARQQTGNEGREDDTKLWGVLNSAFAGRAGVGGVFLADADNEEISTDEEVSFLSPENKHRTTTPISQLAEAMKEGMTAIATSMGTDTKLTSVLQDLKESQEASRELQSRQLALLELLVTKLNPSTS